MATSSWTNISQWAGRVSKSWTSFSSTSSTPTGDASGGIRISSPSSGTTNAYTCCFKIQPNIDGEIFAMNFTIRMYDANSSSSTYYAALCPNPPSYYGNQSGTSYYENDAYNYTYFSISNGTTSHYQDFALDDLYIDGYGTYYLYIYTHSTSDIGIVYKGSSSHGFDCIYYPYETFTGYAWASLGSGTASSVNYTLQETWVGYYRYTPTSNGTLTIYSTGSYDTYGGIAVNGNVSLSSSETSGSYIVTGTKIAQDDDSGTDYNFQCSSISVTAGTTYRIWVHQYSGGYASGTLYMSFTPSTYTVSYNSNGGSGTMSAHSVAQGSALTLKSNSFTAPTSKIWTLTLNGNGGNNGSPTFKNNYFNKWRAGSTSGTAYAAGASYTPTANTTMYAWWGTNYVWGSTTRSDTTANGFKVTFNANSGTCSTAYLTAIDTTKYEFLGWGSSADATAATWDSTSTIGQTSAYTAYAVWKPTTTKGSITLPTPTRTNYTFNGWYTAASGGTKIGNAGASYTPTAATTLYAQWTLNQVTLTLTKGSNISSVTIDGTSTTSKNVTPGTSVTIAATPSSGYHFTNWTGYATITNNPYTFTINEARSYTANAVANTYTVKYNGGTGATGSTASSSHTYGTAKTLTANGFSKFGHTFKGWATSLDRANAGTVDYANQASVSNLTTTNGATVNLYAVWELYTKTYIYTNKKDGTSKWVPVIKYTYTGK